MKPSFSAFAKSVGDTFATVTDAASMAVDASLDAMKTSAESVGQSALELSKSAGEVMADAVQVTSGMASNAGTAVAENAAKSFAMVSHGAGIIGESAVAGAKSAGVLLGAAADSTGNVLGQLGVLAGDLNGDGKVDLEDAKIAAARLRELADAASAELGQLAKTTLQSGLVQDAAAGAVVGGAVATVIPLMGTATGAAIGAALGVYKSVSK